jgi:hypothetical protein
MPAVSTKRNSWPQTHHFVHRIAGGAGDGRDDGAAGAGERVEQRGFAHVGAADDGDLGFVLLELAVGAVELRGCGESSSKSASSGNRGMRAALVDLLLRLKPGLPPNPVVAAFSAFSGWRGEWRLDGVEQVADAQAVLGADGVDVAQAERRKFSASAAMASPSTLLTARKTGLPPRMSSLTRS